MTTNFLVRKVVDLLTQNAFTKILNNYMNDYPFEYNLLKKIVVMDCRRKNILLSNDHESDEEFIKAYTIKKQTLDETFNFDNLIKDLFLIMISFIIFKVAG